jgi:hypothetical protein
MEDNLNLRPDEARALQKVLAQMGVSSGLLRSNMQSMSEAVERAASKSEVLKNLTGGIKDYVKDLEADQKLLNQNREIQNLLLKTGISFARAELMVKREAAMEEARKKGIMDEEMESLAAQYDKAIKIAEQNEHMEDSLENQKRLSEIIVKAEEERKELINGITSKAQTLKDIFTDQRVAAAMFTSQVIKGYDASKEMFSEVRHEGHTVTQAFHETGIAISDAFSLSGVSAKDSLEVMKGMRSEMGSVHHVTREARIEAASLAKTFGITNEQSGQLTAQFATMPGATMESANNTLEFAGNLSKAAGVAPGEVMASIANSSEDVATYTKDGGKNIAVAAVAAKKLGVDFSTITKAAEGLLDFESSINKQMEASVLLGREINLDKAREAALNGDLVTATEEMLKNVGGEAEFNKMNVVQRKALADSMGVSVADLSKMVKHQDELTNLTEEQREALATGELSMDEALANAGGFASKMWESTKTVGSMVMGFGELSKGIKDAKAGMSALFGGTMNFLKGMKGGGGLKGGVKSMFGGGGDDLAKTDEASSKMKGGGKGFKDSMKGLADGFKEMGVSGVLKGIINTAIAGPALILALPSIPFLLFMGLTPLKMLEMNFEGLAKGLAGMGTGKVAIGSLNLMLFALAAVIGLVGIPFMLFLMLGTFIGIGLQGLASGLSALANPMVAIGIGLLSLLALSLGASIMMMGIGIGIAAAGLSLMFKELANMPIENMMLMPIALQLMGVGLLALGVASFIAAPGLFFATLALAGFAAVLALMQPIMAMGGLQALADGLTAISASAGGLTQVGLAVMGIGAGLGMMALAGLAALPVIGALIGLAAVAPALGALGGVLGGGGGKDDKMDALIGEVRELKAIMAQGGVINMDGRKVGDVLRLGMTSSAVK